MTNVDLRLSVQRALLGEVTENLAGLRAYIRGTRVVIEGFYFKPPTNKDSKSLDEIAAEIIADFPDGSGVETSTNLISQVETDKTDWNFLRAEALTNLIEKKN